MDITQIQTSKMGTNTYIVAGKTEAFIVDPGDCAAKLIDAVKSKNKRLAAILLTHAHFDHIGAVADIVESENASGNQPLVFVHKDDAPFISSRKNIGAYMGVKVKAFTPDILLVGGEELQICGFSVKVLHTAGHTPGGVCYVVADPHSPNSTDRVLFSGDTLFKLGYGRTDLFDASFKKLKNAIINKLFRLSGDMLVLPGHGDATTIDYERRFNPILSADDPHINLVD